MNRIASLPDTVRLPLYRPLTAVSNIRLLALEAPSDSKRLCGHLLEHPIESIKHENYIAMSYHWGEPYFDHEIELDGQPKEVTQPVFEMLQHLAEDSPGLYWIDQICINQADLEERAAQILLMKNIYQNASHVQVWLGGLHPEIEPAYKWISSVVPKLIEIFEDERLGAADKAISKSKLLDDPTAEKLDALFESEWYSRLWIVQEVTVSPNPVVMRRGAVIMDFDVLSDFGLLLDRQDRERILSDQAEVGMENLTELRQMRDPNYYERFFTTTTSNVDLLDLLCTNWGRRCLDPRDHIYALAGLAHPQHLPYPPSYEEPVDVIYMDYAIHRIGISHNLRILEWCRWSPDRLPNLPSWAPDWTHVASSLGTPWKQREKLRIYSAGGSNHGQHQQISLSRPKGALTLRGVLFDRIHQVITLKDLCQGPNIKAGITEPQLYLGNGVEALMEVCRPRSPLHMPWDVFWRFIFCDKSVNDRANSRALPEDMIAAGVFVNHVVYTAQAARLERQKELVAAGTLDPEATLLDEPRWGEPLAEFRTRPPEWIQLPSNPILSYLKMRSIIWEMRCDDMKIVTLKSWRKLKEKIKPTPPPKLQYPDPLANHNNQYKATQDAQDLFQHIVRGRSFAVTASGRVAWVPDCATEGDQVAIILAYDLPLVIKKIEDDEDCGSSGVMYAQKDRPDQYEAYKPEDELHWVSGDNDSGQHDKDKRMSNPEKAVASSHAQQGYIFEDPDDNGTEQEVIDKTTNFKETATTNNADQEYPNLAAMSSPAMVHSESEPKLTPGMLPRQDLTIKQTQPTLASNPDRSATAKPNVHTTYWPHLTTRQKVHGEKFIIIGEAYVHGVMDGEVVEDMDSTNVRDIVFV